MNFLKRALSRLARRAFRPDDRPMRAVWKEAVIADSERTVVVEGNHYFQHAPDRLPLEGHRHLLRRGGRR